MSNDVVLLTTDTRGVATITLNRPEVNNAYNGEVIDQMAEALRTCAGNDKVRVVIVRANGKHFQAGADLNWLRSVSALGAEENIEISRRTADAMRGLDRLPKPTVALVHGGCFGGGVGIVASCDVVIASEDASFAITEACWGLMAGIIIPQLNAAIGVRNVRRYALSCERFDAARAQAMGLVHELCPPGGLDKTAEPIIDQLLLSAPDAVTQTKLSALDHVETLYSGAYFENLIRQHADKRRSAEAREGMASFQEKRKPAWCR
ncbi:MAG: enoyl-CoA hydratase-related protein [Gammaproteobacteria bacterium]|nr:MAG: enoyl-CoA hydratase-related protein [Gammaproteobacteria bacterium]